LPRKNLTGIGTEELQKTTRPGAEAEREREYVAKRREEERRRSGERGGEKEEEKRKR
jgi:hypothetical protein